MIYFINNYDDDGDDDEAFITISSFRGTYFMAKLYMHNVH